MIQSSTLAYFPSYCCAGSTSLAMFPYSPVALFWPAHSRHISVCVIGPFLLYSIPSLRVSGFSSYLTLTKNPEASFNSVYPRALSSSAGFVSFSCIFHRQLFVPESQWQTKVVNRGIRVAVVQEKNILHSSQGKTILVACLLDFAVIWTSDGEHACCVSRTKN